MKDKSLRGKRFVKRNYPARTIAYVLGFMCMASVLQQNNASVEVWIFALANGLLWPHIAYYLAWHSQNLYRAERGNLLFDGFWAGVWLPIIEFNILPSYANLAMVCMGLISCGGLRFLLNGVGMIVVGIAVASLFTGISFNFESSTTVIYFTLPYIIIFPLLLSTITYALASQLRKQKKQLQKLRRSDSLSGLYNRMYWEEQVAHEFRRFQRVGNRSSVILLDVDNFKLINDRHGHIIGDRVIRHIGDVIIDNLRDIDIAGRYGGEEFGVVLPDTPCEAAQQIGDRLRRNIEQRPVPDLNIEFTVSVGVAELTEDLHNYSQWLESADGALYRAKQRGRNRTIVANTTIAELG